MEPLHDKHGRQVYPGDLIRTFHFRGARRKVYYLYHTAVSRDGGLELVPTAHLEPTKKSGGGACWASQELLDGAGAEIIDGAGPNGDHWWDERKDTRNGVPSAQAGMDAAGEVGRG